MKNTPLLWIAAVLFAITCLAAPASAQSILHNSGDPLDVDGNGFVQPLDALLIINHLELASPQSFAAQPLADTKPLFLDTNDDSRLSPLDALLVINHLAIVPTPEPSTLISAGLGGTMLVAYAIRRRRAKA